MSEPTDLYVCKRELRRLYDRYPAAFEWMVMQFLRAGEKHWHGQLLPMEAVNGKPVQVNEETLAMLLADYRIKKAAGVKRRNFLERLADHGCSYGNAYFQSRWNETTTINSHLKRAEKLAKIDPFSDRVAWFEWALVASDKDSSPEK
jgi:hypothetical protein